MKQHLVVVFLIAVFTAVVAGNVTTQTGALTSVNVFTEDDTNNWAGIYGEVSGVQAVGGQNSIFEWGSGEARNIYFSEQEIDFEAEWKPGNSSLMEAEYPFLKNSTDGSGTFNNTTDLETVYQNQTIENIPAAFTSNSSGTPAWKTGYIYDGENGFFVGEIDSEKTSFNGKPANYQVMLPEDGSDSSPSSYQVWVELTEG